MWPFFISLTYIISLLRAGKADSIGSRLTVSHIGMSSIGVPVSQLLAHEHSAADEVLLFQRKRTNYISVIFSCLYENKLQKTSFRPSWLPRISWNNLITFVLTTIMHRLVFLITLLRKCFDRRDALDHPFWYALYSSCIEDLMIPSCLPEIPLITTLNMLETSCLSEKFYFFFLFFFFFGDGMIIGSEKLRLLMIVSGYYDARKNFKVRKEAIVLTSFVLSLMIWWH